MDTVGVENKSRANARRRTACRLARVVVRIIEFARTLFFFLFERLDQVLNLLETVG